MACVIETEVMINATPARVWVALTRFDDYAHWNPFIVRAEGRAEPGARLTLEVARPSGRVSRLRGSVLMAAAPMQLRWLVRLWMPGLLDAEHGFILEDASEAGTRLMQRGRFEGFLALLMRRWLERELGARFEAMNRALKQHVEAGGVDPGP